MTVKLNVVSVESIQKDSSYYGGLIVSVNGLSISDLFDDLSEDDLFREVDLSSYVDWAEKEGLVSDILDRLSPSDIIAYLKNNGELEES